MKLLFVFSLMSVVFLLLRPFSSFFSFYEYSYLLDWILGATFLVLFAAILSQRSYPVNLFKMRRHDEEEIGSKRKGTSFAARRQYVQDMISFFGTLQQNIDPKTLIVIIIEDRFGLLPEIFRHAKLKGRTVDGPGLRHGEKAFLVLHK